MAATISRVQGASFNSCTSLNMQRMCEQYRTSFEEKFKGHSGVAVFEVSLVDKFVFRLLKPLMERNLRKIIPEKRHVRS